MGRVLRWIGIALVVLVAVIMLAVLGIFARASQILGKRYDVRGTAVTVPQDSASIAEGERLARTYGCNGCHGKQLEGQVFSEDAILARVTTPNLTEAVRKYSDAELEGLIRHGIRPDGTSLKLMPSEMYTHLTDDDFGKVLAFMKSQPPATGPKARFVMGPLAYFGIAFKLFQPAAAMIDHAAVGSRGLDRSDSLQFGRYVAYTHCTECHGANLRGNSDPAGTTPSLQVTANYTVEEFATVMKTGVASGGRTLNETMTSVARSRFSHFTDGEIRALHAFLRDSLR